MVVRLSDTDTEMRSLPRNAYFTRHKRRSITADNTSRKRRKVEGPKTPQSPSTSSAVKQLKLNIEAYNVPGAPLFFGIGDMGQLGLGPDIVERLRPARLNTKSLQCLSLTEENAESFFVQVCAGGVHTVCLTVNGSVLTCGCNDEGALGRKTVIDKDEKTEELKKLDSGKEVEDQSYQVVEESRLGYVCFPLNSKIVMVSAGDSHAAALDSTGKVWIWGTFRGSSGPIGLTFPGEICPTPRPLLAYPPDLMNGMVDSGSGFRPSNTSHLTPSARVVKIASGQDHLVCLTEDGRLYTMGCGEQGQLGRVAERFAKDGGRFGLASLLQPTECRVRGAVRFSDTWAGSFATFAKCQTTGAIYSCGLNNYGQLGLVDPTNQERLLSVLDSDHELSSLTPTAYPNSPSTQHTGETLTKPDVLTDRDSADKSEAKLIATQGPLIQFMLSRAFGYEPAQEWVQFAISMHHTLALNKQGQVFAIGRTDYGRLGLGSLPNRSQTTTVTTPTRICGLLDNIICTSIGCGEACSYAVDLEGKAYSWGIGSNQQLGHGDSDDDCWEPQLVQGKQLQNRRVLMIDAGGQHTVLLTRLNTIDTNSLVQNVVHLTNNFCPNPTPLTKLGNGAAGQSAQLKKQVRPTGSPTQDISSNLTQSDNLLVSKPMDSFYSALTEPILIAPIGGGVLQTRRTRRASPASVTGSTTTAILGSVHFGCESTTGSTAGATINSSVHSSVVSDTSSVCSCASNSSSSTSSQLNSAKSTDGGGSSRCSSAFDSYSVQSNLLLLPLAEDVTSNSGVGPVSGPRSDCGGAQQNNRTQVNTASTNTQRLALRIGSSEMSVCSTSSDVGGILTDTLSLGSTAASPAEGNGVD